MAGGRFASGPVMEGVGSGIGDGGDAKAGVRKSRTITAASSLGTATLSLRVLYGRHQQDAVGNRMVHGRRHHRRNGRSWASSPRTAFGDFILEMFHPEISEFHNKSRSGSSRILSPRWDAQQGRAAQP